MNRPYDQAAPDPWNWEADCEMDWPWPTFASFPTPGAFYEPCPLGCDKGAAFWADGLTMTCPCCAGSGIGKEHRC